MEFRFNQSDFSAGQFDPRTFARDDYAKYYKAAKVINNAVVIPQGGVQSRWGTDYVDTLVSTNPLNVQISNLIYDDSSIYLLVWEALTLKIYLEDKIVATVVTPFMAEDVQNIQTTQVQNRIVIANEAFNPRQLARSANAATPITAISAPNNTFTFTAALTANTIYPVQFATTGTLPTTSPQIFAGRNYFIRTVTTTTAKIYSNTDDAYYQRNAYGITALGSNSTLIVQNTWTLSTISFIAYPSYDFNSNYSTAIFTHNVNTGTVTITSDTSVFTPAMVKGVFTGDGGSVRLTGFTDDKHMTGYTTESFLSSDPIPGAEAYLAEPAWSDVRGWPRAVSFYQSRLVFGGSPSVNNGVWLSVTNQAYNFDDSNNTNADDAISYTPSSGGASFVRFITSARTLLVHTNTGTYSTSVSNDSPVTPSNFNLIEQNKDGVGNVQPIFIDNQIIYVDRSGNNAKNLVFDIIQGAYVLNNISVASSNCISHPVDVAPLTEPNFTDGAYVLFVNEDGTLGIFQTLVEQNIAAWTTANTTMSDGSPAPYTHITSSINDCWLLAQRTVNGSTHLYIERIDFDTHMDCTSFYFGLNSATVTGLSYLEGEEVYAWADGYLLPPMTVTAGQIVLPEVAQDVQVGLKFDVMLSLLPIGAIPQTNSNLYKPMHIRVLYVNYYQTIGGTISGAQIQTVNLANIQLDTIPEPTNGVKELALMGGWKLMDYDINIEQNLPLPMTILGIGYILESP